MEALLRLSSKRDAEWFKDQLKELHGLDHIIDTGEAVVTNFGTLS